MTPVGAVIASRILARPKLYLMELASRLCVRLAAGATPWLGRPVDARAAVIRALRPTVLLVGVPSLLGDLHDRARGEAARIPGVRWWLDEAVPMGSRDRPDVWSGRRPGIADRPALAGARWRVIGQRLHAILTSEMPEPEANAFFAAVRRPVQLLGTRELEEPAAPLWVGRQPGGAPPRSAS